MHLSMLFLLSGTPDEVKSSRLRWGPSSHTQSILWGQVNTSLTFSAVFTSAFSPLYLILDISSSSCVLEVSCRSHEVLQIGPGPKQSLKTWCQVTGWPWISSLPFGFLGTECRYVWEVWARGDCHANEVIIIHHAADWIPKGREGTLGFSISCLSQAAGLLGLHWGCGHELGSHTSNVFLRQWTLQWP